ncbi:tyrosine-type recombinase/integrase [Paractinoplanes maris]|uniref:tyrosine-type recombinase/integrase n=1 Tax=Paractinoplanes maris TaxID=1734446 RepID=UPI0020217299|nr:site-specific integrase [Actinoplanes maris]
MTTPNAEGASQTEGNVALVAALMAQLNITADQLPRTDAPPRPSRTVPTFDEYILQVAAGVVAGTRRVYDTYWRRIRERWGHRRLDEPTPLEITQFAQEVRDGAVVRRNHRGGAGAAEHLIAAFRCIYRYAVADRLIEAGNNPAARVDKPHRQPSLRHALPDPALAAIVKVAGETRNDPNLDLLILRPHIETACRRGGALAIRRHDLDTDQCLVLLRDKGQTQRWQPISPTLTAALVAHHNERSDGSPDEQLLRYRSGRAVGRRRYDHLWQRIGTYLPWVAVQQISVHWIRHTTLTWIERHFSYAIARAFAGHAGGSEAGTTATYVKATLQELARALATMTGEPHPIADMDPMATMLRAEAPTWLNDPPRLPDKASAEVSEDA